MRSAAEIYAAFIPACVAVHHTECKKHCHGVCQARLKLIGAAQREALEAALLALQSAPEHAEHIIHLLIGELPA